MNVPRIAMDQPGWVWRAALGVAAFIIALPLTLLVILALLVAAAVFGVLALIASVTTRIRTGFRRDGRQNVRVVVRQQP